MTRREAREAVPVSAEPRRSRRASTRRTKLFVGALALGLALAAAEGGVRVIASLAHRGRGMGWDADLGWRPLPGVHKRGQIWGVAKPATTNSEGWRDIEWPPGTEAGASRMLAVGDSFTFGVGVDDGERFTDRLRRECGAEILNLGVAGWGPDQELRLMEVEAPRHRPAVYLVTIFLGNDLDDIRHDVLYSWPKPYYRLERGELQLVAPRRPLSLALREGSYLVELVVRSLVNVDAISRIAREWESADSLPLFRALVRRMADVAAEQHARLVFVVAYHERQIESGLTEREQRALAALSATRAPVLDTFDDFAREQRSGRKLFTKGGGHWNAAGHELVASTLCRWPEIGFLPPAG